MDDIIADLHTHTTLSDGQTDPENVVEVAKENNLRAIAITDHDRIHSNFSHPLEVRDGIDVINSVELRVTIDDINERVDILGYGATQTSRLNSVLSGIRQNRIKRAQKMIDLIEDETGVRIEVEMDDSVGRPDIARSIESNENLPYDYGEAFDTLISRDGPCYVSRNIPTFEYGVEVLRESCEFLSLAHPYRYDNVASVLKMSKHLDGVECFYPYDFGKTGEFPDRLDEMASRWFNITMTGGSDAHKPEDTARSGLDREHYKTFLSDSNLEFYSTFD